MALGICIQHQLTSEKKAATLRGLLDNVAKVTLSSEPDNRAYCWFQKAPSCSVSGTWIGGLEIYDNEAALTETHRASAEYQLMRKVSASDTLWGPVYPEIVFMKPLDFCGFLNNGTESTTLFKENTSTFIVIHKHTFTGEGKDDLMAKLTDEANALRQFKDVSSYVPLMRQDNADSVVTVFQRYASEEAYNEIKKRGWLLESNPDDSKWTTTSMSWSDGIGHIRGPKRKDDAAKVPETQAVPLSTEVMV